MQGWVRKRETLRGVRAQIQIRTDKMYRQLLIHYLHKLLKAPEKEERWKQLLVGADNNEVVTPYTDYT
jgi:hypothetical protein